MPNPEFHAPDPPVLIHDCETVGTMDVSGTEIPGGSILIHRANGLLCDAHRANHVWGTGRQIVADGRLTTVDQDEVVSLAREVIRAR